MKKFLKWFASVILVLLLAYLAGPKPSKPTFTTPGFNLPASLSELEKQISESEKRIRGLKPDNEARIVWADTSGKEKTGIAFLYLHGFSASQGEGIPVHNNIAKRFNANLYLSRLEGHGVDLGDSTMADLTSDSYFASAEKALQIAEKLGDTIIVIGTSAGGMLTLKLASMHPEIKAVILYSPCVQLYDKMAPVLDNHWGKQIVGAVAGPVSVYPAESDRQAQYWTLRYNNQGLVALQNLITSAMKPEVFAQIKCPVLLAYYYKNDEEQDKTVSVPAMLKMFNELGTPANLKMKIAFPEAGAHVIASDIRSKDWQGVERETEKFLSGIVGL